MTKLALLNSAQFVIQIVRSCASASPKTHLKCRQAADIRAVRAVQDEGEPFLNDPELAAFRSHISIPSLRQFHKFRLTLVITRISPLSRFTS
jgi:hypothetical protein